MAKSEFIFELSLSILNHLGRGLYRSFATVIGEAISNSWDAEAENVHIYVERETNSFVIKDDGIGMDEGDFQGKFLRIGYSKRNKGGDASPNKKRPFIGRKGIGKLALLSCAEKITVISRNSPRENYTGGAINNSGLTKAIDDNLIPKEYPLEEFDIASFGQHTNGHHKGTIILFEDANEEIRASEKFLRKVIALYFRFSLVAKSGDPFNIYVNDKQVTLDDLKDIAEKTEFVWNINGLDDPYIREMLPPYLKEDVIKTQMDHNVKGFLASVGKTLDLNIRTIEDGRVSVDLFVNGRLRAKDILKEVSNSRLSEGYFYGQIHFDDLDDDEDRFTASREGIRAGDDKYKDLLESLKPKIRWIFERWGELRRKHREETNIEDDKGDARKKRKAEELYNAIIATDYSELEKENPLVKQWLSDLSNDASFNYNSYGECFISENLVRNYIREKGTPLGRDEKTRYSVEIRDYKNNKRFYLDLGRTSLDEDTRDEIIDSVGKRRGGEKDLMKDGNISPGVRENSDALSYLDLYHLAMLAEALARGATLPKDNLTADEVPFRPLRNAVMHTSLLAATAKRRLTTVYDNILEKVKGLLAKA